MKATIYRLGTDSIHAATLYSGLYPPGGPRSVLNALRSEDFSVNCSVPGCISLLAILCQLWSSSFERKTPQFGRLWFLPRLVLVIKRITGGNRVVIQILQMTVITNSFLPYLPQILRFLCFQYSNKACKPLAVTGLRGLNDPPFTLISLKWKKKPQCPYYMLPM